MNTNPYAWSRIQHERKQRIECRIQGALVAAMAGLFLYALIAWWFK